MNPVEEDRALDEEDGRFGLSEARGREAMDPATRRLAMIAGGIGLLLAVLIGGWAFGGRHASSIPVIEAPDGPVRLKPIDAGGMQALGAQAPPPVNGTGSEALAPGPETARPEALQAEVDAARRAAGMGKAPAATSPAPAVAPPASVVPPAAETPADDERKLRTEADPAPLAATHGLVAIQLAALDSHDAAQAERKRLSSLHPELFSPALDDGKSFEVVRAERDGRAIYRLRMLGFDSAAAAASFCRRARAQDVACTVADF
nr:SPOR domain-containing protein [uncultured Lichenicoccus sp.]